MTSVEDTPAIVGVAMPPEKTEWLSPDEIDIFRAIVRAVIDVGLKKSDEQSRTTSASATEGARKDVSNSVGLKPVILERTAADPKANASNVLSQIPDNKKDSQVDTGGRVRLEIVRETEERVSDVIDDKRVTEQTIAAVKAEADVTGRYNKLVELLSSVLDAGVKEKEKPDEEDFTHKLYKGFKEVNDKLQLLENAISRLGGVGDVLSGIRQLRAALVIALWWDEGGRWYRFRDDVKEGKLDSAEKVLGLVRDWPDLEEDGTVFESETDLWGKPVTTFSDVNLLAGRISTSAGGMEDTFNELGTVNGCQFVSLSATLRAVKIEIEVILENMNRYASSEGLRAEELARKLLFEKLPKYMSALSEEISKAIERDIPNLRTAEQRLTDKYTSMSTTATFFSSITITAIQMSSIMTGNELKDAVNTVWFTSLVFSIGSVIVSLIGLSWFQSPIPMRTSEEKTLKKRIIFLLRKGPVMLMTAAAATFMLGLALFVNTSGQARSTSIVTSSFVGFISVILIFLAIYFAVLYQASTDSKLWRNVTRFASTQRNACRRLWQNVTRFISMRIHISRELWHQVPHFPNLRRQDAASVQLVEVRIVDSNDIVSVAVVDARAIDYNDAHTEGSIADSDPNDELPPLVPGKVQFHLGAVDGPFAVANSETSFLQFYKHFDDTSPIANIAVSPPLGEVKELLWSPDNEHLLVRTQTSLSIWSEKDHVLRPTLASTDYIKAAIWMNDSDILSIQSQSFIYIDCNTGNADEPKRIPENISIVTVQCLDDEHLVCIADDKRTNNPVRKLLVMNHTTGAIVYEGTEIKKTSYSLELSVGEGLTKALLSFKDGSRPELWHLQHQNLTSWEVQLKSNYYARYYPCRSPASFAGSKDELVVCAVSWLGGPKADSIWVWSTNDATLIQIIYIESIHTDLPTCITCKVDDAWTLVLAAAYDDGKLVKGRISIFDTVRNRNYMTTSHVQMIGI